MTQITTIQAFYDNAIYLWHDTSGHAVVVDPGQAEPVLHALKRLQLDLKAILCTHHHNDHIGGVTTLKRQTGCQVMGPDAQRIPSQDQNVTDGDTFNLLGTPIEVLATPGHTKTSVCYHTRPPQQTGWVWTGDTLFVGGCGRLFECDANTMWGSLQKLMALPDDTIVYCGHDYTQENRAFALSLDPDNQLLQQAVPQVGTVSTIGQEKESNIFLLAPNASAFAGLRQRKDHF